MTWPRISEAKNEVRQLTEQLDVRSGQELVEDVKVTLHFMVTSHSRLKLDKIEKKKRSFIKNNTFTLIF